MSDPMPSADRFDELRRDIEMSVAAGGTPDAERLCARYPEFAAEVRGNLAAWVEAERDVLALKEAGGDESPPPEYCGDRLGDYTLGPEVGRGGMGVVYAAWDRRLKRRVAVKVFDRPATGADEVERFRLEAQDACRLEHDHIVPVLAAGEDGGRRFYAMWYIDGADLAEVIKELRRRRVPEPEPGAAPDRVLRLADELAGTPGAGRDPQDYYRAVARLIADAAEALQHAHEHKVVHRDVKPSNLLLTAGPRVWLTDFGLALSDRTRALSSPGELVGTARYMSPEQASRVRVDERTDVYSLGATLYELLTLRPLVDDRGRGDLVRAAAFPKFPRPRQVDRAIPVALEVVAMKAVERDPEDRYESAGQFAADLTRFVQGRPVQAGPPGRLVRAARWVRRNPKAFVVAAAVALALLGGGLLVSSSVAVLVDAERAKVVAERARVEAERDAARAAREEADAARGRTEAAHERARKNLYLAHVHLAARAWDEDAAGRAAELLAADVPPAGELDLRGWEWFYLSSLLNKAEHTLKAPGPARGSSNGARTAAFSPPTARVAGRGAATRTSWCGMSPRAPRSSPFRARKASFGTRTAGCFSSGPGRRATGSRPGTCGPGNASPRILWRPRAAPPPIGASRGRGSR